ncbi:MAG: TIGR04211 family SH3 domain-containing protein [Desulfobacterales bacterium]|nr:TIGR04211 family SH3 domain-containing protein [Desulfobacterales bacterium]
MKNQVKRTVLIGSFLAFFAVTGFAESMYISDKLKVTVRRGPSTEYKILDIAESGERVEILETGEDWTLVRLDNGKEGYVTTRYLMANPTHAIRLEQLQAKHKSLTQQAAALLEENTSLREENKKLLSTLSGTEKSLKKLDNDYQELKAGSAEFLSLKTKYKQVSEQLTEQTKKADILDKELSKVELNQYIKWFLAGSGVLLVGFIIGFSAKRQRRRPSLL